MYSHIHHTHTTFYGERHATNLVSGMLIMKPGVAADAPYPLVWELLQHLQRCGRNVITFSFDGASPNRCKYQVMVWCTKQEIHFVKTDTITSCVFSLLIKTT